MAHSETPPYVKMDPFEAFILDWDAKHNNEPFWSASHELDPYKIASEFGFKKDTVFDFIPKNVYGTRRFRLGNSIPSRLAYQAV